MPTQLSSLSQHRRLKDPKVRLFTDYMAARIKDEMREGRSFRSAVPRGWARARKTILSGNAVSFIAALVLYVCLLYTSPSQRDRTRSRTPSSA